MKLYSGLPNDNSNLTRLFVLLVIVMVGFAFLPAVNIPTQTSSVSAATDYLEGQGYIVLSSVEYETLNTKLDNVKSSADLAVTNAQLAVVNAQAAVIAAQIAAAKVDLFNSAEVFLFPSTTNLTVTLTAGNTNVWNEWTQIVDNTGDNLTSKFTLQAGYVSEMYIYEKRLRKPCISMLGMNQALDSWCRYMISCKHEVRTLKESGLPFELPLSLVS